uniref:PEGA domain-containing protein n=1 Tax=uncultured Methanofollis sp. TaxID=262500 RepID=UPI00260E0973
PLMMAAARITHPHVWNVSKIKGSGNYSSLQAIPQNKIGDGDTIRIWGVEDRVYEGGIVIDAPDVTVTRWDGSPAQPVITGPWSYDAPVFTVTADNATFRDLKISGNTNRGNGAGINAAGSDGDHIQRLTIADCTFTGNTALISGGGAYIERCTGAEITNCIFTGNTAKYSDGGGACINWCTGATITNCTFTENTAFDDGGGAYINGGTGAEITNCTFAENTAEFFGGGACINWCTGATITNCIITENSAQTGGGACINGCTGAEITNCIITENSAQTGGGVYINWCTGATITNCRFDNSNNLRASSSSAVLNTSRTPGTNIAGGPYLGGNLWLRDPAQNISEWCADADFDGICDEPLTITKTGGGVFGTDSLPLVYGGTVTVASTPAGAYVHLDGVNITRTTDTSLYLPIGEHDVTVTLAGYKTRGNQTVTVYADKKTEVTFELERECGEIDVKSVPEGARILLDGVDKGVTNAVLDKISTGPHNVTVTLKDHVTQTNESVMVYADKKTEVTFELERERGEIDVKSVPVGARILLDGVDKGETNAVLDKIPTGPHNVTVTLKDHVTQTNENVMVYADQMTEVTFKLERECGEIDVKSVPVGARILLDGVDKGETNAVLDKIPTGPHNVTVTLKDHVTQTNESVMVYADQTTEVTFELERECGILNVSSVPEGARIVLDGVDRGQTNAVLDNIPTGPHNVTVTLKDYVTQINDTVTVEAGKTTEVTFKLERECGILNVSSVPEGARIVLDGGETEWSTNATLEGIPTGDHKVTVELAGYVTPENQTVNVYADETTEVVFELERECGFLNVSSVPAGARIVLDGVDTGKVTDAILEDILPGEHNVTVTLDGYVTPENRTVTVSPDETTEVAFALEALPGPTPTPTPSPSGSGGGHSDLAADSTGKIPAGGTGTLAFRGSAIYEIRVTVGETIQQLLVTIGRSGLPSGVGAPASVVYEYDEVTLYHTTDDAIEGALILFSIPKAWLEQNNIDPADVVLYRYHDGAWQALTTGVRDEDATFWYFSAESTGFSLFAIGGEPAPVAVKTAEAGEQAGTTEPAPTVTETPAAPPKETPQTFPTTLILGAAAAIIIIAAVVLWKRR